MSPQVEFILNLIFVLGFFLAMVAKLAVSAYFLLSAAPSDITSTPTRRCLFLVGKITPPLLLWSLFGFVRLRFPQASIVYILLAFLATGVTVFA